MHGRGLLYQLSYVIAVPPGILGEASCLGGQAMAMRYINCLYRQESQLALVQFQSEDDSDLLDKRGRVTTR